jgi:2,3-bisphosphoglycerate-dependent phosphoglycerate mutase
VARRRRASKIEIVFETHSTTTDNERWVASGWLDGQLSPLGRRQAKELGERREDDEIVAVFCSDLARAVETAQIAFGGRGLPIFHDWRLRECNYGMLNGTAVARLEVERTRHVVDPYSGGESYTDVVARARSFLQDLSGRYADKRVVVIGVRPRPRRHPARRARRGLVPLAARLALHTCGRRLTAPSG